MNSHNHSIVNQIGHHEPLSLKTSSMTSITSQAVGNQVIQENNSSTMDSSKSMNSQQAYSQPIPYPPPPQQQYHHPHISVSHVPNLYKPPHFSSSSSSSSSPHQQHHSQSKLNVPMISTSNNNHGNGGTSVVINSNGTKQNAHLNISEPHQTVTAIQRNDNIANNCVSNEKAMSNSTFSVNNKVSNNSKIANHTSAYHKNNSDVAAKDNKLNADEKSASESPIRQPQLLNQNHVATNSLQEKSSISHQPLEQQEKGLSSFHPVMSYTVGEKELKNEIDCSKIQCDQNNVLSTLPFQSSFKFSINDIAQKPMDTQLMQSIKSEEVLRTCQNVSNVLLQIPKYQEKLLNFSTSNNELKTTAFCFTDKCNNLTEISVKCEPSAVLNVPDLSKTLVVKQDMITSSSEKSFLVPETQKELTSSLDLAEKRRKRRREKNVSVTCSSDSEGEEETKDVDLWITKGPPAKLQYSEDKLTFLAMFGLTTLTIRNGKRIME